jgi:orotidine 5'-phosphate decarboxylase subfamily 2
MESFFSFLERRVDDCSSLLCVGLDPHISDLSAPTAKAARAFCLTLVKQTARYAAAFKPNAAFFEVLGPRGWTALRQVIEAVAEESARMGSMIPVILDAKRGDIASTAEAYARSAFDKLGAHAITLNPYLGRDSIEPFLHDHERGVFLLCKTSNAGAGDLQDLMVTPVGRRKHRPTPVYRSTGTAMEHARILAWSSVQHSPGPWPASARLPQICGCWPPA